MIQIHIDKKCKVGNTVYSQWLIILLHVVPELRGHKFHTKKLSYIFLPLSFPGLDLNDEQSVIQSVQTLLQPDIERRLTAKKRLDDMAVTTLLENIDVLEKSLNSRQNRSSTSSDSQDPSQAVPSTSSNQNDP